MKRSEIHKHWAQKKKIAFHEKSLFKMFFKLSISEKIKY